MTRPGRLTTTTAVLVLLVLAAPLVGLFLQTPWSDLTSILGRAEVGQALRLSLATSTLTTLLVMALGLPVALVLARGHAWWTPLARVIASLPAVLPPVAAGMALLAAFGRYGWVGQWLDGGLPFTPAAVVVAQAFVALPFFVLTLESGLRRDLSTLEEAAATMGAGRWQIWRHVTFPLVGPSLVAGAVLAWTRALGEFGATITFAGNVPGRTQTLPLSIYLATQHDLPLAYALATVLTVVSGGLLLVLQGPIRHGR